MIPPAGPEGDAGSEGPGAMASESLDEELVKPMLVMSGGEGYVDFRAGKRDLQPFLQCTVLYVYLHISDYTADVPIHCFGVLPQSFCVPSLKEALLKSRMMSFLS